MSKPEYLLWFTASTVFVVLTWVLAGLFGVDVVQHDGFGWLAAGAFALVLVELAVILGLGRRGYRPMLVGVFSTGVVNAFLVCAPIVAVPF